MICMYNCMCLTHGSLWKHRTSANLRTKIPDFRGLDSSIILILRGGILMSIGNLQRKFGSTNLSRDNLSREIGRIHFRMIRTMHCDSDVCEKRSFWVSPCLAIPQQKLLSSPRFCAPKAYLPNSTLLRRSVFFTDTGYTPLHG